MDTEKMEQATNGADKATDDVKKPIIRRSSDQIFQDGSSVFVEDFPDVGGGKIVAFL